MTVFLCRRVSAFIGGFIIILLGGLGALGGSILIFLRVLRVLGGERLGLLVARERVTM